MKHSPGMIAKIGLSNRMYGIVIIENKSLAKCNFSIVFAFKNFNDLNLAIFA